MSSEVSTKDISKDDVEKMSEEADIKEEIIESSLEIKRANEKFNRYKTKDSDNSESKRSTFDIIKNGLIFIPKLFIDTRHAPVKGEITNIKNPKNTDKLIIEVTAKHNKVAGYNEKNADYGEVCVSKNVVYNLEEDTDQIEYILNKTDSKDFSEIVGKSIPIIASSTSHGNIDQDLPEKPYNIADRVSNVISVFGGYFLTREEGQSIVDPEDSGKYGLNMNAILISIFSFYVFGEISKNMIEFFGASGLLESVFVIIEILFYSATLVMGCLYLALISFQICCSIQEIIYKEPDERYVIREVINS